MSQFTSAVRDRIRDDLANVDPVTLAWLEALPLADSGAPVRLARKASASALAVQMEMARGCPSWGKRATPPNALPPPGLSASEFELLRKLEAKVKTANLGKRVAG